MEDPFEPEQRLEVISYWDGKPGGSIRVSVFAVKDMGTLDLVRQFERNRKDREDFLVFTDGRTDPPFRSLA